MKNKKGINVDSFSYKIWGNKTEQYIDSICNLTESEWDAIIGGAEAYLGEDAGKLAVGDDNDEDDGFPHMESDDERAHI